MPAFQDWNDNGTKRALEKEMRIVVLGFSCLLASGCAGDEQQATTSDQLSITSCGADMTSDPFDVGSVAVDGNDLLISVDTGGGCVPKHSFSICWNGAINDTSPGIIDLALRHHALGDTCDGLLHRDLRVDLAPVIGVFKPPWRVWVIGGTTEVPGETNAVLVDTAP